MEKMTDAELIQKLGESYYAPVGFYKKTKDMPFLGSVSCNINEVEAGSCLDRMVGKRDWCGGHCHRDGFVGCFLGV